MVLARSSLKEGKLGYVDRHLSNGWHADTESNRILNQSQEKQTQHEGREARLTLRSLPLSSTMYLACPKVSGPFTASWLETVHFKS